jgi:2',3'-cyclic-nucleotide 2'-phosphodiesterase
MLQKSAFMGTFCSLKCGSAITSIEIYRRGVKALRIMFIGDLVGKPGRNYLQQNLHDLKLEHKIDVVIANGENAAGGAGITKNVFNELRSIGVDIITGGNHIWDQKDIYNFIEEEERMIRPANYPVESTPGRGTVLVKFRRGKITIAVINLIGRVFMRAVDCPFKAADREIDKLRGTVSNIIVDFHAEATSEKQAMGWYLDGRVSAVVGTHCHVQTADERILPKNTAYITDVGMVGLYDSILGVDKAEPLSMFLTQLPHKMKIGQGRVLFNAALIDVDETTGKSLSIERVFNVK